MARRVSFWRKRRKRVIGKAINMRVPHPWVLCKGGEARIRPSTDFTGVAHSCAFCAQGWDARMFFPCSCTMNPMQSLLHTSARVLEFESLRDLLRGYASSPLGQRRISNLAPSTDREWIENQQRLTSEIREFRRVGGRFDFSGLLVATTILEKSRIAGAALETEEIRDVILIVDRAAEWRKTALSPPAAMKVEWKTVAQLSSEIPDFTDFLRGFRNKIQPDGTLEDRASPELARIRREMEKQRRVIQDSLRGYLRRLSEGGAVQDELITIRGERFVIPVKVEQKRRVNGVVHGASSSGQTVFVEPLETIEQNNELVRLLEEENVEIHRILLEMTARIGEQAPALDTALDVLAEIELQFAKARFARDYQCVRPRVSSGQSGLGLGGQDGLTGLGGQGLSTSIHLQVTNARHPVLECNLREHGGCVVPISLELAKESRQLIISGPNTGGKTVGLKTIGLLALMAQSGMPVPGETADLPVFDSVFADIGDYRSSRTFPHFRLTSGTLTSFRKPPRRARWCCWTNSALLPIRKKAPRSPSLSLDIFSILARPASSLRITLH